MSAPCQTLRIRHCDTDWHDPFFIAVDEIFGCGDTFRRWQQAGGWNDHYEVFALTNDRRLASIIGVMDMHFLFDGAACDGIQLGAVGTLPGCRENGLSRRLMDWVLAERGAPDRPAILFANETVLNFYPRFGFKPVAQHRFFLQSGFEPNGRRIHRLDMTALADRTLLADWCARAAPINRRFAARDYFPITLWHLVHGTQEVILIEDMGAILIVSRIEGSLIVHDVYSPTTFDLMPALAAAIETPVERIEFCFDPEEWLAAMPRKVEPFTEDPCFLHWSGSLTASPCRFPDFAHT